MASVDQLGPTALQDKFRSEYGVYADRGHLLRWLKAPSQALRIFSNNEDIHSHPCGEYVLESLQHGATPEAVVEGLLKEYLVRTTTERVVAYRYYREQRGKYWTAERLRRLHWEWLYEQVSLDVRIVRPRGSQTLRQDKRIIVIRDALCLRLRVSEELVPIHSVSVFYK